MEDYIVIPESLKELGLTLAERTALALIWGFDRRHNGVFYGSNKYIAEWLGVTERTVKMVLAKLLEGGYIVKGTAIIDGEVKRFFALSDEGGKYFPQGKKFPLGGEKISPEQGKKFPLGGEKISPNNTRDNTSVDNTRDNTSDEKKKEIKKEKPFVPPTLDEVSAYVAQRGGRIDAEAFWSYYESNGWRVGKAPMRNWKAAVVTWERRHADDARGQPRQESPYEHTIREMDKSFGTNYYETRYGKR